MAYTTPTADFFAAQNVQYIDYKDIDLLKKFLNPHGKILARRRTGLSSTNQRALAVAIKRARFMALLPYVLR